LFDLTKSLRIQVRHSVDAARAARCDTFVTLPTIGGLARHNGKFGQSGQQISGNYAAVAVRAA
jgi:hypothetical protein